MTLTAKHVIVTDECRTNRSNEGAMMEAIGRLVEEYLILTKCHPVGNGVKLHFKLDVEFALPE